MKQLVADHCAELLSHNNWIIDVRDNGGGSDSTYEPLMGWLLDILLPEPLDEARRETDIRQVQRWIEGGLP